MPAQIVVVNNSNMEDDLAWRCAWTLNWQLRHHVGPIWNISTGATFMPRGIDVPNGSVVLHLLNISQEAGTLGFHDEDGNEVPFTDVFIRTAEEDGVTPMEVVSHEGLELALNPHVDLLVLNADATKLYPHELCDACQGNAYGIGAAGNQLQAADFVLPGYFDTKTPPDKPTSYRGSIHGPLSVGPKGYMSFLDLTNIEAGWQQTFGAERTALPAWASRLPQLHAKGTTGPTSTSA